MSTKEAQDQIVKNMRKWQKVENASVMSTSSVVDKTENPVIRLIMEVIQRDSHMHHRVQGMIADSLEQSPMTVTPEEISAVWDLIEKHAEIEKTTIDLATSSLAAIEGVKSLTVQHYLLKYLLADEQKHDSLLANLEAIKKNIYP
jgi:hypothetical protein